MSGAAAECRGNAGAGARERKGYVGVASWPAELAAARRGQDNELPSVYLVGCRRGGALQRQRIRPKLSSSLGVERAFLVVARAGGKHQTARRNDRAAKVLRSRFSVAATGELLVLAQW